MVVGSCGEALCLLAWDSGVGLNHCCHDRAESLDTDIERCDVEEDDVAYSLFLVEDGALDGCTYGYDLVRVDAL